MIIIGAGMAGLLTATMLRRMNPVVYEAQDKLPDNHGALLRFRSDAVSRETGIPFKKVTVHKAVHDGQRVRNTATLRDHNMYSYKVTGRVMNRSILSLESVERWIAPPDFLAQLAHGVDIKFSAPLRYTEEMEQGGPWVSTIPMPALMDLAKWEDRPEFRATAIWSVRCECPIDCDVYQTIYYPDPCGERFYRASLTGKTLIVEYIAKPEESDIAGELMDVFGHFGLGDLVGPDEVRHHDIKFQKYGKIRPTDDAARRRFIIAMSDLHQCYSIGRFATWRQILLDDVVNDVRVVERFITERSAYARRLKSHS
jgi:hypothetical protein